MNYSHERNILFKYQFQSSNEFVFVVTLCRVLLIIIELIICVCNTYFDLTSKQNAILLIYNTTFWMYVSCWFTMLWNECIIVKITLFFSFILLHTLTPFVIDNSYVKSTFNPYFSEIFYYFFHIAFVLIYSWTSMMFN